MNLTHVFRFWLRDELDQLGEDVPAALAASAAAKPLRRLGIPEGVAAAGLAGG